MPRRIKLKLEYDGSDFYGWQLQAKTGERTVQGELERAVAHLPGVHSPIKAAGRTDTGVHALAMIAHLDTTSELIDERLRMAINAHLPDDVVILELKTVEDTFEAQFDCLYRRYLYRMRVVRGDPRGLALQRLRVLPVFRTLDVAAMQKAARLISGTEDYSSFATRETRSPVRTVYLCELREEGAELRLHIAADGFLRNMVRTVVGTLLWVGKGKLGPHEIPEIIAARDRTRAGHNVAPSGLYFVEAGYAPWCEESSEHATGSVLL
ncbi:MAG: tRNA pseudouridine(38-40) synthase TruA [Trueperaceae bacterium]|nr:MAG: tRNA pseudouridine(38-40) synthase TruA [Trueperaceae bacterium]